jgi:DnaJ-class molecular chaperone
MPANPDPRGLYALLHVSPDASREEIGRAFRALMRRHHPDAGHPDAGHPDADGVPAILAAFAVLRDPGTRAEYDASGRVSEVPGSTAKGGAGQGGRDIPVRIVRGREPLLRVLPVRWEAGPWPGKPSRGGR